MGIVLSEIGITIVTFNIKKSIFLENFGHLFHSPFKIVIFDNSTDVTQQESIFKLCEEFSITYITTGKNEGMSYALNVTNNECFNHGCKYVLQLDHDSLITIEDIIGLAYEIKSIPKHTRIGAMTSHIVLTRDAFDEDRSNSLPTELDMSQGLTSSGTMITRECWITSGGYNNSMFLDMFDWEWGWRVRHNGWKIYQSQRSWLLHKFGKSEVLMLGRLIMRLDSPVRHYYQYRNTLYLARFPYVPLPVRIVCVLKLAIKLVLILLFGDTRIKRLKHCFSGIRSGLHGIR